MKRLLAGALGLLVLFGLRTSAATDPLESHARRFVMLATSLGQLDPKEIDAYWGPPELDRRNAKPAPSIKNLRRDLALLQDQVAQDAPSARRGRLVARLAHLSALLEVMEHPRGWGFDDQAYRLFGLTVPSPDPKALARARAALDRLLPGRGDLTARLAAWRTRFVIPPARRKAVFSRALAECHARTLAHWPMPPDEKVDVVWSEDVPAAWHRYQGHHHSLLEINPAAVADPGSALDVACHEAYPGHHAQFVAMEAAPRGLPVEDTVVILRSPEQVLREGAAVYGADLAFAPSTRLAFLRDVLFPLAGLDPRGAASFLQVHDAVTEMSRSAWPILRDYYDGRAASGDAMARLILDAQVASPQALLEFTSEMGAYVTGYTVAPDMVARCVAARAHRGERWTALRALIVGTDIGALDSSSHSCARR